MNNRGRHAPPPAHEVLFGEIFALEDHPSFGKVVRVRLPDGREVDCRAMFVGAYGVNGTFRPLPDSGTALVFLPGGSTASASAIVGIQTDGVPSDYNGSKTVTYGLEERRSAEGATVGGVVVRPFLDDLSTFLASLQSGMDSLSDSLSAMAVSATPTTPPATPNPLGPLFADLTAATATAAAIAAAAATLKAAVDTSKAGSGTAPHCSGVLRAQAGS